MVRIFSLFFFRQFLFAISLNVPFFFFPFLLSAELTVSEGLSLALREENLIKIKEYEESLAFFQSKVARSSLLPRVDLSYGKVFLNYEPTAKNLLLGRQVEVPISERDFQTYSVSVRQLIFDFFGASSFYHSEKISEEIKKIETTKVRNAVALEFLRYYYDLKERERMIEVLEREVERLESHLKDAKSLFEEGLITRNELLYTEVLLSDARQKLLTVKNLKKLTASTLNKMMGRPPEEELIFEDPKRRPTLDKDLESYISDAYLLRPELKIIEKAKERIGYLRQAKRAELLPRIFVEGKYSYTENRYQVYQGITSVTLGFTMNLFEGGKTKAELKILDLEEKKLFAEERRLKDEIRIEVEKFFLEFKNAQERLKVTEHAIKQAEENLRITKIKYKEGLGTGTEVLDAIAALSLSENNYHRAFYDLLRAEAGLIFATGRRLEEEYGR